VCLLIIIGVQVYPLMSTANSIDPNSKQPAHSESLTMTMMNMNGNGEMNGETNGVATNGDRSNTPPLQPDKVLEADALEELLRQETLRQIEAAWKAQRRLMQSCIAPPPVKVLTSPVKDQAMVEEEAPSAVPKEVEEAGVIPPAAAAEQESPSIELDSATA
jgi:hypothetical protein